MHNTGWIELFRKIPEKWHDCLALSLTTGMEIVVQRLYRLDEDVVVLQGRQTGTSDGGRLMVLPYDRLVNVAFNRLVNDQVVQSIFGGFEFAAPVKSGALSAAGEEAPLSTETASADQEDEADNEPVEQAVGLSVQLPCRQIAPAAAPAAKGAKPSTPSKSILLARLRERLAEHAKQQP